MSDLIKREDVQREIQASFDGCALGWQDWQDLMDRINAIPPASPWHRVEEPPQQNGAFAVACVYDGKLYWYKGIYLDGKWLREGDGIELPSDYWMPVPEPPKEDA